MREREERRKRERQREREREREREERCADMWAPSSCSVHVSKTTLQNCQMVKCAL
jgi:hypothetical protein